MQRRALGLVVDVVAATADEAASGWSQSGARYRFGGESGVARRGDGVADGDRAALASDEIDAEVLVSKSGSQRARNVEVALAGDRIDVRRAAAAVFSVDRERHAADPYVAADPVELLPGPGAVNIKVGTKT